MSELKRSPHHGTRTCTRPPTTSRSFRAAPEQALRQRREGHAERFAADRFGQPHIPQRRLDVLVPSARLDLGQVHPDRRMTRLKKPKKVIFKSDALHQRLSRCSFLKRLGERA